MRLILLTLACILAATPALRAAAPEKASIHAILVAASSKSGETDRRLAPYEANLRRLLRFESFRLVGESTAHLAVPGETTVNLGQGQSLSLKAESGGRALRVQVRWSEGKRDFMNTGLVLPSGTPAVLGGPSNDKGEVYAIILIAQ